MQRQPDVALSMSAAAPAAARAAGASVASVREKTGGEPPAKRVFADFHIHTRFSRSAG